MVVVQRVGIAAALNRSVERYDEETDLEGPVELVHSDSGKDEDVVVERVSVVHMPC